MTSNAGIILWRTILVTLESMQNKSLIGETTMSEVKKQQSIELPAQLSDQQLEQVAGGVDFDQLRRENLDKDAVDFDQLRRENLDKDAVAHPAQ